MRKRIKEGFICLLFPRRCPVCGEVAQPVGGLACPGCIAHLSPVRPPACRKCGKEVLGDYLEYCPDCARRPKTFEAGLALLNYNDAARRSMAAIKYKNRREYLDFYADVMGRRFQRAVSHWQAGLLIPVPVHPSRRRQRGFNQAEELAGRLGRIWGIPMEANLLVRSKKTAPQRNLNPSERLQNLQDAFQISDFPTKRHIAYPKLPETVILVDDIYTTGSTMEACSRTLKAAGVKQVYFVVICTGGAG